MGSFVVGSCRLLWLLLALPPPIVDQNECSDSRALLCADSSVRPSLQIAVYERVMEAGVPLAAAAVGTFAARASHNSGKICPVKISVLRQEMNCLRTGRSSFGGMAHDSDGVARHVLGLCS